MTKPKTKAAKPKATAALETRTCDKCGNPFPAVKAWQRFCSLKCRMNNASADRYAESKKAVRAIELSLDDLAYLESVASMTGESQETFNRIVKRLRLIVPAATP